MNTVFSSTTTSSEQPTELVGFSGPRPVLADALQVAHAAIDAAADKKAHDIVLLDVQPISSLADYFIICSASSDRQIRAVAEGIEEALRLMDIPAYHREGDASDGWVVLDYSDVVVHVFSPHQREYYALEELWSKARTVVRMQ